MIQLRNINKSYGHQLILSDLSISISHNEFVCIMGESGSGKTTLLNLIGLLDKPDSGKIVINGKSTFCDKDIIALRKDFFGYVFQDFLLIPDKTVFENLKISFYNNKNNKIDSAKKILEKVGLNQNYLDKKVAQLSGGEQQKVAIARMMLKPYQIVLADEPTGNLDCASKNDVIHILKELQKEGKTIICVTHDKEVAESADRIIYLKGSDKN